MARRKKNKNLKGIPAAIMLILALIGGFAERGNLMERMSGDPVQKHCRYGCDRSDESDLSQCRTG